MAAGTRPKGHLVPPPVRRAWPGLAAALAAVALCTTGCNLQISSAASDPLSHHKSVHHKSAHHKAHQHKAARHRAAASRASKPAVTLVTEPDGGFSPVYRLISEAKHSVDITMYEFADSTAERDLAAAARRGGSVRVILDQREESLNTPAYDYFRSRRVEVSWSSPSYEYTHQKTMVIDQSEAVIMTANLTSEYYSTSRDFLVTDTNHRDTAAITRVFDADFAHRAVTPGDGHDLVWSPTDAQARLLGLINGASK